MKITLCDKMDYITFGNQKVNGNWLGEQTNILILQSDHQTDN